MFGDGSFKIDSDPEITTITGCGSPRYENSSVSNPYLLSSNASS
uniref:Uncharacterized protein n=1 Tax=Candidatus Kentrum sp. FM TaxID=2126340 RepID=A0A450W3E3_9GAMM|nr:MAG: hypothetical protein BECKFM1743C_GA0114222_101942 [Candidatus Kentron sp. FM]VFK11545.1 MAG: hypothetical protein BECKFM1743B_GA0114221_101912 [Candidatus Kentron sp. FM]